MIYFSIVSKSSITSFIPTIMSFRKYNKTDDFYVFYEDNDKFYQPLLKLGVTKLIKVPKVYQQSYTCRIDIEDFDLKCRIIDLLCVAENYFSSNYFTYVSPYTYFFYNPTDNLNEILNSNSFYSICGVSLEDISNCYQPYLTDGLVVFSLSAIQQIKDMLNDDLNNAIRSLDVNGETDDRFINCFIRFNNSNSLFPTPFFYINCITSYLAEYTDFKYNKKVLPNKFNALYHNWNREELPIMANFERLFTNEYEPLISKSYLKLIDLYKDFVLSTKTVKGYSTQWKEFQNKILTREFEV